jgi:hypothetical protein
MSVQSVGRAPRFTPSAFTAGQRVWVGSLSAGEARFVKYGPASMACPASHVSYPGMRIVFVQHDRYGYVSAWERDVFEVIA